MQFFKVLLPGCFEKRLGLPPHFCIEARTEFVEEGVVTTNLGRWKIGMIEMEEIFYFHGCRWERFVKRHDLLAGNFIVFKHDSGMKFSASIFDKSCCEKISFPLRNPPTTLSLSNVTFRSTICASSGCGYAASRLSRLYLPSKIWKPYNLHEKRSVLLKVGGCDKMQWSAKLMFYAGVQDRVAVADGWWEFCSANKIKEGDRCTFHIMNASNDTIILTLFK